MAVDWTNYSSWDLVLPPNRPGEALLREIRIALSIKGDLREVCILGSTPEYRRICKDLCIPNVVIIDKFPEFSDMCDRLTPHNPRESKIIQDWVTALPRFCGKFDVVLSHLTHGNVPFHARRELFGLIRNCLVPGGLLIDFVFQPPPPGNSPETIMRHFRGRPPNLRTCNDFNSIALFQSAMIGSLGCVDTSAIYGMLDASIDDETSIIVKATKKITPPGHTWYYAFDKPPPCYGYFEGYEVVSELPEPQHSPFCNAATLYFLRKSAERR